MSTVSIWPLQQCNCVVHCAMIVSNQTELNWIELKWTKCSLSWDSSHCSQPVVLYRFSQLLWCCSQLKIHVFGISSQNHSGQNDTFCICKRHLKWQIILKHAAKAKPILQTTQLVIRSIRAFSQSTDNKILSNAGIYSERTLFYYELNSCHWHALTELQPLTRSIHNTVSTYCRL